MIQKKQPDALWLYQVLHVIKQEHEIFDPSYRYVRQNNQISAASMPMFENKDGFFDVALPQNQTKNKK